MSKFEDLEVWKKAHELVIDVYNLVNKFPNSEKFRLTDQLVRAVVSIPANISEGTGRRTKKDFIHFYIKTPNSKPQTLNSEQNKRCNL